MSPLISVCIPTYNGAKYLRECLDSVLAQTFSDFEVLIIDDQSSDETLDIAKEYAEQDSRIRVIQNLKNLGLVRNWNRCLELAQGEWIKFVFQDDLIAPTCLAKMLLAGQQKKAIVCCRRNFIFEEGVTERLRIFYQNITDFSSIFPPETTDISAYDYCQAVLNRIGYNFVGEPTTVILHRSVLYKFGVFNPYLIQICDFEYWTRIAVHKGITYIPETLATFRLHGNATSSNNHAKQEYRLGKLDQLIFLHDLALNPVYAPIRQINTHQNSYSKHLINLLGTKAEAAWKQARQDKDPILLEEWEKITGYYPILVPLSKGTLANSASSYVTQKVKKFKKMLNFK